MIDAYTFLTGFFKDCPPQQFIELTYIHHDKTRTNHIVTQFVRIDDKPGLRLHLVAAARFNERGYGVYFGVCPRAMLPLSGKRGSEDHVDTLVGFWTELDSVKEGRDPAADLNKLQSFAMPPSLCVLSGGGVHAYWLLDKPLDMPIIPQRQQIKAALRGLGKAVGGDLQVAEFARVLRVPGFTNTKPGRDNAVVEAVLPTQKHRYQVDELVSYAPPPEPERKPRDFHIADATDEVELAQAALNALNLSRVDDYALWTYVGMALRSLGATGLSLWDAWSSRSTKYQNGECERKWNTFDEHGYNIGSLCIWANEDSGGRDWRPHKVDLTPRTLDIAAPIIYSNDDGWSKLSTGERGALNRFADTASAALIDQLVTSGMAGETVDHEFLICIGEEVGLSASSIRRAIKRLPAIFLPFSDDLIYIPEKSLESGIESECIEKWKKRRAGRPRDLIRLADRATVHAEIVRLAIPQIIKEEFPRTLDIAAPIHAAFLEELGMDGDEAQAKARELEARYGADLRSQPGWRQAMQDVRKRIRALKEQLTSTDYAPLPTGAVLNRRTSLLAAAARALIAFLGGAFQMGRAKLCALIGCRDKELSSVCKAAGIEIDKHAYEHVQVITLPQLLAIPHKFDPAIGGFPIDVQSTLDKRAHKLDSPTLEAWAIKQLRGMATLTVRYRLANRYKIAEPEPTIKEVEIVQANIPEPVQQTLLSVSDAPKAIFAQYFLAALRWTFAARLLNALVMAWEVAKEAAWYARQHAQKQLKYAESWLRKVVKTVTPWQPVGADLVDTSSGEKQTYTVQLSLDLLFEGPTECNEHSAGFGSMEAKEPCNMIPKSPGLTTGIGLAQSPPPITPALAISLSP